jgi:hypothetical protein
MTQASCVAKGKAEAGSKLSLKIDVNSNGTCE